MNVTYIVQCADETYYTGWTNDIAKRIYAHNHGITGAKYTKSRRPVKLVYCEGHAGQGEAMRREAEIKQLSRAGKDALIAKLAAQEGEQLAVYDKHMEQIGVMPRDVVHACGLLHRVVHVLVREGRHGEDGVWLQQRAWDRPTLPGYFDWTATGHVTAGEELDGAAVRELREEVGLRLVRADLQPIGEYHYHICREETYDDNEVATTFLYRPTEPISFHLGEEVERMAWVSEAALTQAFLYGEPFTVHRSEGVEDAIPADQLCPAAFEWRKVRKY